MVGFPEGHDRLCALEWLVQYLAAEYCMNQPNPTEAVDNIFKSGDEYGMAMIASASGNIDHVMTAVSISSSIKQLIEPVVEKIKAS